MEKEKLKKDGTPSRQGEGGIKPPLKWNTPEELERCIEGYYIWAKENRKYVTVSGLAWWLNCSRQTLINYENAEENGWLKRCSDEDRKKYMDTIRQAKRYIEMCYEDSLFYRNSVNGATFTLKNNFGWVDRQEVVNKEDNSIEIKLED